GRSAAGVADDVRIAFVEPGELRRIEARIHAGQNREAARRRKRQPAFVAEALRVARIRVQYVFPYPCHGGTLLMLAGSCASSLTNADYRPSRRPAPGTLPHMVSTVGH